MISGDVIRPVDIKFDEVTSQDNARFLDTMTPGALAGLRVHRMGHVIMIGTADPPLTIALVPITSPAADSYAAMFAEAKPLEGIPPHHPV
jgi:hypothetical protein